MDASAARTVDRLQARRMAATLPVYVATIFVSAFLLFGIQPMFAKMVLPKLGGSPGVWSVAMVFFQAVLLAGYGYAHLLVSRFALRRAALIHLGLMIAVLAISLPIHIAAGFERPPQEGEVLWLIGLFTASVGLPFFAVAANGPLLQAWFARTGHSHAADPYFLYAASNAGSFLALIAYPFLVEPLLPLALQASGWAWGFALLLAGIAGCAGLAIGAGRADAAAPVEAAPAAPVTNAQRFGWVALAFVPSGLLVAVTAHISTDVAAVPLLWVMPLALFLLTFVIVFQRRPILPHRWMLHLQIALMFALLLAVAAKFRIGWGYSLALHLGLFFVTAMVAHGELVKRRPDASRLTEFYLWMSFGGVLGGLFCGLLAPMLFNTVIEYPMLMVAGLLCRPGIGAIGERLRVLKLGLIATAGCMMAFLLANDWRRTDSVRSFFGIHRILEAEDGRFRSLAHGTTVHGVQRLRNDDGSPVTGRPEPLSYYFTGGGIADGIEALRRARGGVLGKVASVGVGTGSLACQTRPGEHWTFYEIDTRVVSIATDPAQFSFISQCAPDAPFVIGDARLTLADAAAGSLDLIVVDAFSSDAIPVHLLTREAMGLYLSRLAPGGALLFHISNRNMDLAPVVAATAR
ncbi:spermidine synthase [Bosea sp. (in: a-proteobacteria)]|uniref:spermidine synthase n=1 Tax=Bosea sp. (in: a-proteobacteria) TaxID=1871050 RepID=UPI00345DB26B